MRKLTILLLFCTIAMAQFSQSDTVRMVFAGDMMLSRNVGVQMLVFGNTFPLASVGQFLREANLAFANLESPFGTQTKHMPKEYCFQVPPNAIDALLWAGFDGVSLANNHFLDYFSPGAAECVQLLRSVGIEPIGGGVNADDFFTPRSFYSGRQWFVIIGLNDTKAGFWRQNEAGCAPSWTDWGEARAIEQIARCSKLGAKTIVIEHWGEEYIEFPNARMIQLAHSFIDAGACLIIGSHPHRICGVEFYRGCAIYYSLGNFVFDQKDSLGNVGAIAQLDFIEGLPTNYSMVLTETHSIACCPQFFDATDYISYVSRLCSIFTTEIQYIDNVFYFSSTVK